MDEPTRRAAARIVYESEVVQPAVDALTRALLEITPPRWRATQLVLSFGGQPPVISSPEGHADVVALSPRLGIALAALERLRIERGTGWSGAVVVARQDADGGWQATIDWHYGGLATAPAPRRAGAASVTGTMPAISGDGADRHQTLGSEKPGFGGKG